MLAVAAPGASVTVRDGTYAMGTVLEVAVVAPEEPAARAAVDELFALARRLDALFTTWDPESPLSRLNAAAGGPAREVPPELARILRDAVAYARLTRGAFDPTVGPLVALWREAGETGEPPSDEALASARARVGASGVEVADARARLAREGMAVDLGGLAKGWALDRMAEALAARGIDRAFASFGQSSLLALGAPEDAPAWRVLVRQPGGSGFAGVASLRDVSMSVSGSFGTSSVVGGRRVGHVLDPRSGEPLAREAEAVVVAPSGALAEALSKALLVLPPNEGLGIVAGQPGAEALLLEADGTRHATGGFARAAGFGPAEETGAPLPSSEP